MPCLTKTVFEAGIRNQRLDSYQECGGTLPASGTFSPFSDVIQSWSWNPDAGAEARRGIGGVDPLEHDTGLETHTFTVLYRLQGTIAADTPFYEVCSRDTDQLLEARTIVAREEHFQGGNDAGGICTYVVIDGAKPGSGKLSGDPSSAGPMLAEITYMAEKGRQYEIHQPVLGSTLIVTSSEAGDDATLTVEDDDGVQEAIVISGTGTTTFASIDAALLGAQCDGTVWAVTVEGATLVTIYGKNDYANAEGDLGVPILPTGATRVAALGTGDVYEKFLGDTITYGGGDLAYDINSIELSIDNSVTVLPRSNSRAQRVVEGNRTIQLSATVVGEREYQNQIERHLMSTIADIVWTMTSSVLTIGGCALITPGEKSVTEGQAYMQLNNVFEGTSIAIT